MNERLKKARKYLKMSRKDLSESISMPLRTIQNYETGERKASIEYIEKLHTKFNINFNWLITGQGSMFEENQINTPQPQQESERVKELEGQVNSLKKTIHILSSGDELPITSDPDLERLRKLELQVAELKAQNDNKGLSNNTI